MAEFTGLSADKAEQILGMSVVSGIINEFGHLILTRENGTVIDAGDFTGIVSGILAELVNTQVPTAVLNAVAGTTVAKGNQAGALQFDEWLNSTTAINALVTMNATGNLTVAVGDMPVGARANTQFAVRITQDATGGRTITFTGIKKSQGVLQLTPTANAVDILVFFYDGTSWYVGMMGADLK